MSNGQKQIVHLLHLTLHVDAQIIICDEPTSALDITSRNKVMLILHDLHSQGKTIIVSSHDIWVRDQCPTILEFIIDSDGHRRIVEQIPMNK